MPFFRVMSTAILQFLFLLMEIFSSIQKLTFQPQAKAIAQQVSRKGEGPRRRLRGTLRGRLRDER